MLFVVPLSNLAAYQAGTYFRFRDRHPSPLPSNITPRNRVGFLNKSPVFP